MNSWGDFTCDMPFTSCRRRLGEKDRCDDQLNTLALTCARQGSILPGVAVGVATCPPTGAHEASTMAIETIATRSSLDGGGETDQITSWALSSSRSRAVKPSHSA